VKTATRVLAQIAFLIASAFSADSGAQAPTSAPVPIPAAAQAPADPSLHAVSYVETRAASAAAARAAFAQYRQARQQQNGVRGVQFFEQTGRPGHFVGVETWRDQAAFDARDMAPHTQLLAALDPIRVSGFDQRPYKVLTVQPATSSTTAPGRGAVYVVSHVDVTMDPKVPVMLRALADASRKEPGNLRFDIVQHLMRANHFTVIEGWRNQQALDAHVAAAHTRQYRDQVQPMTGSPLDERAYTAVP
jgi:quinol monooxygenase YgiN